MSDNDKTKTELVMENVHLRRKLAEAEARAERMEKRYKGQLAHNEGLEASIRARKEQIKELKAEREELLKSNPGEAERRILDMWPRFEDGEPVMRGDRTEDLGGEIAGVEFFDEDGYVLWNNACTHLHLSIGKRVKRPAPEVLDADGAPIKKGDTVWREDGTEWVVKNPEFDSVLCFDGERYRTFDPDMLTHREPDSWERLERDASQLSCVYAGAEGNDMSGYECETCRLFPGRGRGVPCEAAMALECVARAKSLAGVE